MNVIYRTKKQLKLPNFDQSTKRQNLELEIIEKYLIEKMSSEDIGKLCGFDGQQILNILRKIKFKLEALAIVI